MAPFIKKTFFIFVLLAFASTSYAQFIAPKIQWAKCFGGTDDETASCIESTSDKGFIIAGYSYSIDFDVTGHHNQANNNADYWIVKLDSTGTMEWERSLGGDSDDIATSIKQTHDGGFIVAGYSNSVNGDVSGNHGGIDYWIVRLDPNGKIIWEKSYGGSHNDYADLVGLASDGGYIIAGSSLSNDKDVSGHHGSTDYDDFWIVKLDSIGTVVWEKSYGGGGIDIAYDIKRMSNNGYVIAGTSNSTDGDVTGNHGGQDYWIIKIDSIGNLKWEKSFGGTSLDEARSLDLTEDGGYIVTGYSASNDGEVSGNHGQADYWIIKLDSNENLQWQKSFGGSDIDAAYSIEQTFDRGFIIAGNTASNNGNVSGNHGGYDYWVIKLDSLGNLLWQKTLGGTGDEFPYCIRQTADSGFIIAGSTTSDDGDVTGHHFQQDYWIVKLGAHPQSGVSYSEKKGKGLSYNYPNPFVNKTTIVLSDAVTSDSYLLLYNLLGEQVQKLDIPTSATTIVLDRSRLAGGVYIYRVMDSGHIITSGNIIIK